MAPNSHVPNDQVPAQGQPHYPGHASYEHLFPRVNGQYNTTPTWDQFNTQQSTDVQPWQHGSLPQQFQQPYGAPNQGFQSTPSYLYSPYDASNQVSNYAHQSVVDPALVQEAPAGRPQQQQLPYQGLRTPTPQGQSTVSPQLLQQSGGAQPAARPVTSPYQIPRPTSDQFAQRTVPINFSPQPSTMPRYDVPKGKVSGGFSLIDQAALAKATNSTAFNKFINIGIQPMHLVTNRTALPIYNARQSSKDLRRSGAGSQKMLHKLAHKSSGGRILVSKNLAGRSSAGSPLALKRDEVSDSEDYTDTDDDSEYTSDEEEEESPLPAARPDEPHQAVRYDIIKATWFPRQSPPSPEKIKSSLTDLWEVLNTIQKRWRIDSKAVVEAEEQKKTGELPVLKSRVAGQRDLLCFALKSLLEFGHPDVLYHLGQVKPFLYTCYQFLANRFKMKDYDGDLSSAIYQVLAGAAGTLTSELIEETKLIKALNSMKKNANDTNKALIAKIIEAAVAGSKKPKVSSPPRDEGTESKGVKRPATQPAGRATAESPVAKKLRPSDPASAATKKAAPTDAVKTGTSSSVPQKRPGERPTLPTVKARVNPVANKSSSFFSTLNAATKKPAPAAPKPSTVVKAGVTAVKDKKPAAAPSKHFSFADTMALLDVKKETTTAPKPEKQLPPETPEEKAKRLRKEARRHLRVSFKPDATLVSIRYLEARDPEEEQGHDEKLVRDAGDIGGEGRMFKQHRDMIEDDDDEEEAEVAFFAWREPSAVDFSRVPAEEREKNYAPYGGGTRTPVSPEKEANLRREAEVLMVTYMLPSDIPDSPAEPTEAPVERTAPVREFGQPGELVLSRYPKSATPAPPSSTPGVDLDFLTSIVQKISNPAAAARQSQPAPVPAPAPTAAAPVAPFPLNLEDLLKNLNVPQLQQATAAPPALPVANFPPPPSGPPPPGFDLQAAFAALQQQQHGGAIPPIPAMPAWPPQYAQGYPHVPPLPGAGAGAGGDAAAMAAVLQQYSQQQQPFNANAGVKRARDDSGNNNGYNSNSGSGNKKQKHARPWTNFEGGKPHKVIQCKFYSLGKCTKGEDCTFIHDQE